MKCPHCLQGFHADWKSEDIIKQGDYMWQAYATICPTCKKAIIMLTQYWAGSTEMIPLAAMNPYSFQAYPKGVARSPLPGEVPNEYADDYREACLVLDDSSKASAALSRRCLQNLLRGPGQVKAGDLSKEIQQVLDAKALPTYLADAIDAVRHYGNFAAHPEKDKNTGTIVPVEPGEAEWLLEVLEGLFDFYFVQPARLQGRRSALDQKLTNAGKSPMKQALPQ